MAQLGCGHGRETRFPSKYTNKHVWGDTMKNFRSMVYKFLPYALVYRVDCVANCCLDALDYARHSVADDDNFDKNPNGTKVSAQLLKDVHRIEKGFSLPTVKRPFGAAVSHRIESIVSGERFFARRSETDLARGHLRILTDWNSMVDVASDGVPHVETLSDAREAVAPAVCDELRVNPPSIELFGMRHSVRDFDRNRPVDLSTLEVCVDLAGSAPSVCNRRPWRFHVFDGDDVKKVLSLQNGNSSFATCVPYVGVVTVDQELFAGSAERNQPYIEGGIFAQNLVLAMTAHGISSCMLNMSRSNRQLERARKRLGLRESETIVMFIAFGYAHVPHRKTLSTKRQVSEILVNHMHSDESESTIR